MSLKAGFVKFILNLQLSKHLYTQITRRSLKNKKAQMQVKSQDHTSTSGQSQTATKMRDANTHTQTHTCLNPVRQVH